MSPQEYFEDTATDLDVINELDQPGDFPLLAAMLTAAATGDEINGRRVYKQLRGIAISRMVERKEAEIAASNFEHSQEIA